MAASFHIAALVTTFFPNSHAGVLASKFLTGFPTDDGLVAPRTRIASLYIDQIHRHDIGLQLAHRYAVPVYRSIRAALTLGGDDLAVDGVLLIGEHGDYPRTVLGQEMLPRRWFFEQVCGVIAEQRRPLPVFVDKHLAYRWSDARWMYDTARELGVPLWAGSSLPVHWRRPDFDHPWALRWTRAQHRLPHAGAVRVPRAGGASVSGGAARGRRERRARRDLPVRPRGVARGRRGPLADRPRRRRLRGNPSRIRPAGAGAGRRPTPVPRRLLGRAARGGADARRQWLRWNSSLTPDGVAVHRRVRLPAGSGPEQAHFSYLASTWRTSCSPARRRAPWNARC